MPTNKDDKDILSQKKRIKGRRVHLMLQQQQQQKRAVPSRRRKCFPCWADEKKMESFGTNLHIVG